MTPTLEKIIVLWTCPHCLGNGRLTSSTVKTFGDGSFQRLTHQQNCSVCQGTGVRDALIDGQG